MTEQVQNNAAMMEPIFLPKIDGGLWKQYEAVPANAVGMVLISLLRINEGFEPEIALYLQRLVLNRKLLLVGVVGF